MRTIKIACSLAALFLLTTCNGVHSPLEPQSHIACDPAFGGQWTWVLQSCGGFTNGSSPAQLSSTNGCRLTLDTTPPDLAAQGQTFTLIVDFETQKATLERKGTICDATDKGSIAAQNGHEFSLLMQSAVTAQKCCNGPYYVNITY